MMKAVTARTLITPHSLKPTPHRRLDQAHSSITAKQNPKALIVAVSDILCTVRIHGDEILGRQRVLFTTLLSAHGNRNDGDMLV
ncbi:MAG: hypothetical protein ACLFWB_12775 [Armatimonadota bacterium]